MADRVVFDRSFTEVTVPGGFVEPDLPAGAGSHNVVSFGAELYVAYARPVGLIDAYL